MSLPTSQRIREEKVSIRIEDAAPNPVECICRVTTYPERLQVQRDPELRLYAVTFSDGTLIAGQYMWNQEITEYRFDRPYLEHLPWQDLQQRCREEFAKGNFSSVEAAR